MSVKRSSAMEYEDRLAGMDFAAHNADVEQTWRNYEDGRPTRTPITLGLNSRYFMFNAEANCLGLDYRTYSENPDAMFEAQLRFQRWSRYNLLQDAELGLPQRWQITVDFENYYEAGWLGCPIQYLPEQVPDTEPAFADRPERVTEKGVPDPMGGLMGRLREYYEHFRGRAQREEFLGRPIEILPPACGTDGVMTVACNLFGAEFVCTAMSAEPDRLQRLFEFITGAIIVRMKAWRTFCGVPVPQGGFWFADDSVALISTAMYRQHVLPFHWRICEAMATPQRRGIHLCGDATRHFKTIRDELGVTAFDTGFPVDFGALRRELGPQVRIQGGPHIELLRTATPARVHEEVKRIMTSGVLEGGLFVLREGNNLAPGTPPENVAAMYQAGRELGRIR